MKSHAVPAAATGPAKTLENVLIEFTSPTGDVSTVFVDNATSAATAVNDPETGEVVEFLLGTITTKDEAGDFRLMEMCASMDEAGVHHHSYDAKSGGQYRITRIGATLSRLEAFAEAVLYQRSFEPRAVEKACKLKGLELENPAGQGDGWYAPYDHLSGPYNSKKRRLFTSLSEGERVKLLKRLVCGNSMLKGASRGCGLDVDEMNSSLNKQVLAFFVLHNQSLMAQLQAKWMPMDWPWKLPLDDIANYFGEEVGFYFSFLGHLSTWSLYMAPVGICCQALALWSHFNPDNRVTGGQGEALYTEAWFSVVSGCAYALCIDSWRCEQAAIAHRWKSFGCRAKLPPRPGFNGVVLKNPVTGQLEIDFPNHLRAPRARKSVLVSATMLVVLLGCVVSLFVYRAILASSEDSTWLVLLVPSILNTIQVTVFSVAYKHIAEILTRFENHKTMLEHNSALFTKLTVFYFVNNFATLFYIAFVKGTTPTGCSNPFDSSTSCGYELSFQVFMIFIVNDFVSRLQNSVFMPEANRWVKGYLLAQNKSLDVKVMGPIEKQFRLLAMYDPTKELVMDYIELYVQWGFLTLFGSAFPLASTLAFVTNFIETRTDGRKLFRDFRRVMPNQVDGIGEPLNVFYYMLYLAVPVNAALVVYTYKAFRFLSWVPDTYAFIACVVLGLLLLVRIEEVYPEVSEKTEIQLARASAVYSRVVDEHQDHDASTLNLNEALLGVTLAEVKARAAAAAVKTRPVMRQRKVPAGFKAPPAKRRPSSVSMPGPGGAAGAGGLARGLGSGLGGSGHASAASSLRHPELEAAVAGAVKNLSHAVSETVDSAEREMARHVARGDKVAVDASRIEARELDAVASDHSSFFMLAAEAARAEARRADALAGPLGGKGVKMRMKALEAEVARAVSALAEATAEVGKGAKVRSVLAEKDGDWTGVERAVVDLLAAEASAAEQASFYGLAAATAEAESAEQNKQRRSAAKTSAKVSAAKAKHALPQPRQPNEEEEVLDENDDEYNSSLTGSNGGSGANSAEECHGEKVEDDEEEERRKWEKAERKRLRGEKRDRKEAKLLQRAGKHEGQGNPMVATAPARKGKKRVESGREVELTNGSVAYDRAFNRDAVSDV